MSSNLCTYYIVICIFRKDNEIYMGHVP